MGLLEAIGPAVWTIENVPSLFQRLRGFAKFAKVCKMQKHCQLCQMRKRMVLSNLNLNLKEFTKKQPTLHDKLGPRKGWAPDAQLLQKDAWNGHRTTHGPSYTCTGGAHYAGARSMSDFSTAHLLDWKDKAIIQGVDTPTLISFPTSVGEQFRKRAIANMVPPPFAKQICLAALEHVMQRQLQFELDRRVALLMTERGHSRRRTC